MSKHEKIDLKVSFEELTGDEVYDISYRSLTVKESKAKELTKARKAFQSKCGEIATLIEKKENIESALKDAESLNEMTDEKDEDARLDILKEKFQLNKDLRIADNDFAKELKKIKDNDPTFESITAEYGKIVMLELSLKMGGKDKAKVIKIAKEDGEYPILIGSVLDELYKEEIEGK